MKYSTLILFNIIILLLISSCKKDDDTMEEAMDDPIIEEAAEDYEALKAIYNANPNNSLGWDLDDKSLLTWDGVTLENNRMTELTIPSKGLTKIPSQIGTISELKTLGLANNSLATIPMQIENLNKLEVLNLEGNALESLMPAIGNNLQLKTMSVKGNQLRELPFELGKLFNLNNLNIEDNLLTNIPYEICILADNGTNVQKDQRVRCDLVNYHYRGLVALAEANPNNILGWDLNDTAMASWTNIILTSEGTIEELDLQSKGLSILPKEFGNLIGLKHLNLTSNGIPNFQMNLLGLQV